LFFDRDDGNWRFEAVWCGGGSLKEQAWTMGIIDGHWYCHPCLAKIVGLADANEWRGLWVNRYGESLGTQLKDWRIRCADLRLARANENNDAGSKGKSKGKTKIGGKQAAAKRRKLDAENRANVITPEEDERARIAKLVKALKKSFIDSDL